MANMLRESEMETFCFICIPFKNDWKLCILMFLHIPYVPVCVLLLQCESVKLLKAVV